MGWEQRLKRRVRNFFIRKGKGESTTNEQGGANTGTVKQYRLEATRRTRKQSLYRRLLNFCGIFRSSRNKGLVVGINPNQRLAMYLHWMFRVNFVFLFLFMCIMFFGLVIFFAGLITIAGRMDEQCVRVEDGSFAAEGAAFADAFALSWTTFSTVGYGSTYPALGYQNDSPTNCFFISFICSLEALVGVLYSGFCGAILFGKVLRIQSHAQVIFSDPIVIRYGTGISESTAFSDDNDREEEDERKKIPCPVLEFRIANRLFNEIGGEIMDSTLNVVANVDANDADPTLHSAFEREHRTVSDTSSDTMSDATSNHESFFSSGSENHSYLESFHRFFDPLVSIRRQDHRTLDEDPSSRLISKQLFSKMMVEASDHPFFKRVWLARHVLDEHSPIMKARVRRQIRKNGGNWPERLNNYSAIRDSLQFNQILVSLNGVSNISASDVYAQKIYDFVDINIGYQFVNILYRDNDGSLGVDLDLINDVREQNGGGGEPLIIDD